MSHTNDGMHESPYGGNNNELDTIEQLLTQGITLHDQTQAGITHVPAFNTQEEDDEHDSLPLEGDLQGALALYAEAAQDMATATVELSLGRHFACADFCNQAVEKAAQSLSLLRSGRRTSYDHDLRALGEAVGAPAPILEAMEALTPFHPEAFYADTPPEEADEVINAEQASQYIQYARSVMRWARDIVMKA